MKKINSNKGFTQIDIIVSIIILFLFAGFVATLFYNAYISSISSKKHEEATIYLSNILETVDLVSYDNIESEIISKVNSLEPNKLSAKLASSTQELSTPYKANIEIINYNQMEGNKDKEDLVKLITVTIDYNIKSNKKDENITAKRLKVKDLVYEDSLSISPILYNGMIPIASSTKITDESNSNWFDYSKNKPAKIMLGDTSYNEETGEITNAGSSFIYIPRFAYNIDEEGKTNIKFLNPDNSCKDNSATVVYPEEENIDNTKYYLPSCFDVNEIKLQGIWVGEYLCKMNTEGNDGTQIYVGPKNQASNYKYWTDLTDEQKQEQCNYVVSKDANYGLSGNIAATYANDSINKMLKILKSSKYSFIPNEIKENESEFTGSFRLILY